MEKRTRNWLMTIGSQDIDRLKPSEFMLEQAKANTEGNTFKDKFQLEVIL